MSDPPKGKSKRVYPFISEIYKNTHSGYKIPSGRRPGPSQGPRGFRAGLCAALCLGRAGRQSVFCICIVYLCISRISSDILFLDLPFWGSPIKAIPNSSQNHVVCVQTALCLNKSAKLNSSSLLVDLAWLSSACHSLCT